jgi:hypothetical protein
MTTEAAAADATDLGLQHNQAEAAPWVGSPVAVQEK